MQLIGEAKTARRETPPNTANDGDGTKQVIGEGLISQYGVRAVLVGILLLTLSPAASHALARAAYKSGIPQWDKAVADEPKERQ